ncbi:TPA: ATP-binding protein, partial [Enterococcus faecalis]
MQIELPYKKHQDNLLLTRTNEVWAFYKVYPTNVSRHNPQKRQEVNQDTARLSKALAPYKDFMYSGLPRNLDMHSKVKELKPMFAPGEEKLAEHYLDNSITLLEKDNGLIYERGYLVEVKISSNRETTSLKSAFKAALKQVAVGVMGLLGFELESTQSYFDDVRQAEEDLFTTMRLHGGQRLTHEELLYHTRSPFIRNQPHKVQEEVLFYDVQEAGQALVDSSEFLKENGETVTGVLKLSSETGTSYVKILPIYDLPDHGAGLDLHRFAEEQGFPVEFLSKIQTSDPKMVGLKLHFNEGKLKEQESHAAYHQEEVGKKNLILRFLSKYLRDEMDDEEPLFKHLDCLVVYGRTVEQILERAKGLQKLLQGKVGVSLATKDQMRLFYQLLPGVPLTEKSWISSSNAEALGEYAFATAEYIGMRSGFYIGRIDTVGESLKGQTVQELVEYSSRYVFLNPLAIAEGIAGALYDTPHIAITGKSGKGKTFLAGIIFLYSSLFDVQCLFVDPKAEKRQAFEAVLKDPYYQQTYPWFCDYLRRIHYVTLDA